MIKSVAALVITLLLQSVAFGEPQQHELRMSVDDRFIVAETDKWDVVVEKLLAFRFANVEISPKQGQGFSLMLYFLCDTPDLAEFDTPKKMKKSVLSSSKQYLKHSVEKSVELKELNVKGWYGFRTTLTDKEVAGQIEIPEGEFKFLTRGMIRISPDSALGFSLMTNDLNSPEHQELMEYIFSFAKEKK